MHTEKDTLDFEQKLDQFKLADDAGAVGAASALNGQQLAQDNGSIPKVSFQQRRDDELVALQQAEEDFWGAKKKEQERRSI